MVMRSTALPGWIVSGISLALILSAVVALHKFRETHGLELKIQSQNTGWMPPPEYLKMMSFGYDQVAADLLWLKSLQLLGANNLTEKEYEWLYQALNAITTLDPQYAYAYQTGAIILSELAHRVDLSNKLLEKGLKHLSSNWQIPFYLGYNHFFFLQNYRQAADYMAMASILPGHPSYLTNVATRLYAEVGQVEVALNLIIPVWQHTQDSQLKTSLERRIRELIIERDIHRLEDAVRQYRASHGVYPPTLSAMVEKRFLQSVPHEPFGGEYWYEPESGKIQSSTHPTRLGVGRWKAERRAP